MASSPISKLHRDYPDRSLTERTAPKEPFRLFHHWFRQALKARLIDPNAMAVTTVNASGRPSARMVLLRGLDREGFVFFTNYLSRKGRDLAANPEAGLLFFWPQLGRQVRVEGRVRKVSAKESDGYFATRPRGSQLSAWASSQSRVIGGRDVLERKMKELEKKYEGRKIPRPPHWGGYRVIPSVVEFWSGRKNRLHDRLNYRKKGKGWVRERLAP